MGVGQPFQRLEAKAGKAAPFQVARCIGFLATIDRLNPRPKAEIDMAQLAATKLSFKTQG